MANDGYPSSDKQPLAATLDALTKTVTLTSASTAYVIDSVLVQKYAGALWELTLTKGIAKRQIRVNVWHDGSATVAATTPVWNVDGGAAQGTVDVAITATLTGSGATQALNLVCTPSSTGWTANSFRIPSQAIPQ
jgi:hypothetical protein